MALEDRGAEHDKVIVDKYHDPQANYQMTPYDYVLRPQANGQTGAITITLPPVAEAKGRWYSIVAREADAINTITVEDKDDSECWVGDIVMDAKCNTLLLYSDGLKWTSGVDPEGWPSYY